MIIWVCYFILSDIVFSFIVKNFTTRCLFIEPVSNHRNHRRRTTVSSFASSVVNNLVIRPCWLCRWYVVRVRHLVEVFFTISKFCKEKYELIIYSHCFKNTWFRWLERGLYLKMNGWMTSNSYQGFIFQCLVLFFCCIVLVNINHPILIIRSKMSFYCCS